MEVDNHVAGQIEKIRECFLFAQQIAAPAEDLSLLVDHLENTVLEFRSVAYEGAAMELALKDLMEGQSLARWRSFSDGPGKLHGAQVHVGLGWALAQQEVAPSGVMKSLDPLLRQRVADGIGYYDGLFRSRRSINNQLRFSEIPEKYFQAYDIGIGRSLWYRCEGVCEEIGTLITGFSDERRKDLWLGVGIACTYVGGFTEGLLTELGTSAAGYCLQLAIGTALAARARTQSGTSTSFAEMACRHWCSCSASEASELTIKAEPSSSRESDSAFKTWLFQIELALKMRLNSVASDRLKIDRR